LLRYAQLLLIAGRYKELLAAFEFALPQMPDIGIRNGPAIHDGALIRENTLVNGVPTDPQAFAAAIHVARGICDNCVNDHKDVALNGEALKQYAKALALEPDSGFVNYYYACGLEQLG